MEEKRINDVLKEILYDILSYMGLPEEKDVKSNLCEEFREIGHLGNAYATIQPFLDEGLYETANHILRVSIYSFVVGSFIGLRKEQRDTLVLAALFHDLGKISVDVINIAEKKIGFDEVDRATMENHVSHSSVMVLDVDIKTIIALHHSWQKNPYGVYGEIIRKTKENEFLSKILALIDFHDSAATRVNTRNSQEPRLLKSSEVKDLLIKEYSDMEFGDFIGFNNGKELIEGLYKDNIFGREDVKLPYNDEFEILKYGKRVF